jgi:hypothetical protein
MKPVLAWLIIDALPSRADRIPRAGFDAGA